MNVFKNERTRGYAIAYCVIMAVIIGFGALICYGAKTLQEWAYNDWLTIFPLAALAGIGLFISQELWDRQKEEKKKERNGKK